MQCHQIRLSDLLPSGILAHSLMHPPTAIKPLPGEGLSLDLTTFRKLTFPVRGGDFWEPRHQQSLLRIMGTFLPRVTLNRQGYAIFQLLVNGEEVTSQAQCLAASGEGVPTAEISRLRHAISTLRQEAEDPAVGEKERAVLDFFRLPHPEHDPELYWLYGPTENRRLFILWGAEKLEFASLPPESAVDALPIKVASSKLPLRKLAEAALWMGGAVAAGTAAYHFLQPPSQEVIEQESATVASLRSASPVPPPARLTAAPPNSAPSSSAPASGGLKAVRSLPPQIAKVSAPSAGTEPLIPKPNAGTNSPDAPSSAAVGARPAPAGVSSRPAIPPPAAKAPPPKKSLLTALVSTGGPGTQYKPSAPAPVSLGGFAAAPMSQAITVLQALPAEVAAYGGQWLPVKSEAPRAGLVPVTLEFMLHDSVGRRISFDGKTEWLIDGLPPPASAQTAGSCGLRLSLGTGEHSVSAKFLNPAGEEQALTGRLDIRLELVEQAKVTLSPEDA